MGSFPRGGGLAGGGGMGLGEQSSHGSPASLSAMELLPHCHPVVLHVSSELEDIIIKYTVYIAILLYSVWNVSLNTLCS